VSGGSGRSATMARTAVHVGQGSVGGGGSGGPR
jgi:hypothetical protein